MARAKHRFGGVSPVGIVTEGNGHATEAGTAKLVQSEGWRVGHRKQNGYGIYFWVANVERARRWAATQTQWGKAEVIVCTVAWGNAAWWGSAQDNFQAWYRRKRLRGELPGLDKGASRNVWADENGFHSIWTRRDNSLSGVVLHAPTGPGVYWFCRRVQIERVLHELDH